MSQWRHEWKPPGPGPWELETSHFGGRAVTPIVEEIFPEPFRKGFAKACARYGLLLDHLELRFVNGIGYTQPAPVGAPPGISKLPPKFVFTLLLKMHPELRQRIKICAQNFERKPWREELAQWDREIKPAAHKAQRALQAVDPNTLSGKALGEHLIRCRDTWVAMIEQHHSYNMASLLPIGDLLAHVTEWTRLPAEEILSLLRGSTPVSAGQGDALDALVAALRRDDAARARLERDDDTLLDALRAWPGEVGRAATEYLDLVSHQLVGGFDVTERCAIEVPGLLARGIRQALDEPRGRDESALAAMTESVRSRVPAAQRPLFDELLQEARTHNRLRGERAIFSDAWSSGQLRRALLATGNQLLAQGRIADREHVFEARIDELVELLSSPERATPSKAELAQRREKRLSLRIDELPARLGPAGGGPPPFDWFAPAVQRTMKAVDACLQAMANAHKSTASPSENAGKGGALRGFPVSRGQYEGTARVIRDPADLATVRQGDVLVTMATSAAFNVVLPLLGGLVTERGGALSHAAIVAREFGLPAVVGAAHATTRISDGARVRIDGARGEITIL